MLYFIRHGKTNNNVNKILTGREDVCLNEEGISQANVAKEKIKDLNIDLIFCSPLKRARQTCEIINEKKIKVVIKDELVERSFGKYENKNYDLIDGDKCWNYFLDEYKEIESLKEVFGRVYKFLDEIKEEYNNKNILIVAHNDIGRAIYCYFNGIPLDGDVRKLSKNNAEIVSYNF